jgi:hypothetical protein
MSRVLGHASEDIGQPSLWVHVVHFGRDDEAVSAFGEHRNFPIPSI